MRRREFIALTAGAAVIWPFASAAQKAGRTYRLGILAPFPREEPASLPFFNELRRRGFIEGQNLTIYYRDFGPHVDLISEYATELARTESMSSGALGVRLYVPHNRRRKRFQYSEWQTIWLGRDWWTRWPGQTEIQRASVSSQVSSMARGRKS